jgi:sulfopyruvate decarboxylase subunit beta
LASASRWRGPTVRVFVLDGDGSLLMNLGSLATIGLLQPVNFVLIVMDNEQFATTGGQPTPTSRGADLDAAARAMRVPMTLTVRNEEALSAALEQAAHSGTGGDRRQSGRVRHRPRSRRSTASR